MSVFGAAIAVGDTCGTQIMQSPALRLNIQASFHAFHFISFHFISFHAFHFISCIINDAWQAWIMACMQVNYN